ncbi:MAG: cytidylate kinase, partial [Schaalia hyovaginalis]|nr:cytidylate kinase [Schaalia hyovaginalis]
ELMEAVREQITKRDEADSTVSQFLTPAEGVVVVDSTGLGIDGVTQAVLALVDQDLEARAGR